MQFRLFNKALAIGCVVVATLVTFSGCQKERIVDVKTPAGSVEVNRDKSNGHVDVDVRREPQK